MFYRFPTPIVLEVSGKDAPRYLNNRVTNDLRGIAPGSPVRAAILNPQGRTEGLFSIHLKSDGSYLLVCEGGDLDEVSAALTRYKVADRVNVRDLSQDYSLIHLSKPRVISLSEGALVSPVSRVSPEGIDVLLPREESEAFIKALVATEGEAATLESFNAARARFGGALFPDEINNETIITEVGLKNLVSFSKGCYVGQEVIERSDAIGKVPRTLETAVFPAQSTINRDDKVLNGSGDTLGKVTNAFTDPVSGEVLTFVLLRNGKYEQEQEIVVGEGAGRLIRSQTLRSQQPESESK